MQSNIFFWRQRRQQKQSMHQKWTKGNLPLQVLHDLGYRQPGPTKVYSDNSVVKGIAHDEVTLRRSRAMHTKYHWLRDRVRKVSTSPTI